MSGYPKGIASSSPGLRLAREYHPDSLAGTEIAQNDEVKGVARALAAAAYSAWIDGLSGPHAAHMGYKPKMLPIVRSPFLEM